MGIESLGGKSVASKGKGKPSSLHADPNVTVIHLKKRLSLWSQVHSETQRLVGCPVLKMDSEGNRTRSLGWAMTPSTTCSSQKQTYYQSREKDMGTHH
jgi:hypothetical protein